ncbi:MAG: hypothetical protein ACI93R_004144, partial [Flavobacteriales bacterium]
VTPINYLMFELVIQSLQSRKPFVKRADTFLQHNLLSGMRQY